MSTALSPAGVEVRDAGGSDLPAVRRVLLAAYQEYAMALPPAVLGRYLAEILDVEERLGNGRLLVAEHGGRVVGTVTWYDDAATEGLGWPSGWAGLRALGVEPSARGLGIGRALVEACRRRALAAGAPALTLHTGGFMTAAVALYEAMGFRRDPAYDFDATRRLRLGGVRSVPILAYRLDLTRHHAKERIMGGPAAIVGELYEPGHRRARGRAGHAHRGQRPPAGGRPVPEPGRKGRRGARPPGHHRGLHRRPGPARRAPPRPRPAGRPRDPVPDRPPAWPTTSGTPPARRSASWSRCSRASAWSS
ncbi:MAG TPA: GNAT family N-acetyltransferase [Actinomycetota bacterium]|nr:GNAT family N-acetyltransferase [Actinomycetota bacterium]